MIWPVALILLAAPSMKHLEGGEVKPFFKLRAADKRAETPELKAVKVKPFFLDERPVTEIEFLEFVRAHPKWQKSSAPRLFVDERYLSRWKSDLELPIGDSARSPATEVSWFAAKAYCAARGARLPTLAEWELALEDQGHDQAAVTQRIIDWYQAPRGGVLREAGSGVANGYGVRDLAGLVWEWTLDFDGAPTVSDSREGGEQGLFCGSGGAQAADPSDQAKFMRYAFRSSLKASYTTKDLGFRCAKD